MRYRMPKLTLILLSAVLLCAAQVDRTPFEIVSFKIVSYYNPLLERSAPMDAGGRELERTKRRWQSGRARIRLWAWVC